MDEALRVIKNTAVLSTGKVWMILGNALFTIIIARQLGVAGFGVYVSLTTLWDLFRGLIAAGLSVLVVREIAKDREKASLYLSNGLLLTWLLTILSGAAVQALLQADPETASVAQAGLVITLALLPATAVVLYEALFFAFERMEFITAMTVVETVVRVGLSLILLWQGRGLIELLAAMVVSQAAMLIGYHVLFSRRLHRLSWRPDLRFMRTLAQEGAILAVQNGLATIGSRIGVLTLTFLSGSVSVGLFAAAGKLERPAIFIDTYRDAVFPNMSRLTSVPDKGFRQVLEKSLKYLLVATLPMVIGLAVLADQFILLFYSAEYSGAIILLQVMVWGLIFKVFVPLMSRALIALGRQDLALRITAITMLIGVIISVILVPSMGAIGLLIAGYISDVIGLVMLHRYLVERNVRIRYAQVLIRPALAGATMGITAYLMHGTSLFLTVPICAAIYGIAILVYRVITPQEWSLIHQAARAGLARLGRTPAVDVRTE